MSDRKTNGKDLKGFIGAFFFGVIRVPRDNNNACLNAMSDIYIYYTSGDEMPTDAHDGDN